MITNRGYKTAQSGFTLVEFIVATAVLAIMGGVAYGGWFNVTRIADRTEQTIARYDELQRTFYWFAEDFEQIVKRDAVEELGGKRKSIEISEQGEFIIQVTRGGWTNPALLQVPPRSHLQSVAYYIDADDRLLRRYWYHVDRFDSTSYRDRLMVNDVVGLTFRFLTASGEWTTSWPPEESNNLEEEFDELPIALETTIELDDLGSARRLYVLPN
jgi:type II secretion system protein J